MFNKSNIFGHNSIEYLLYKPQNIEFRMFANLARNQVSIPFGGRNVIHELRAILTNEEFQLII